MSWCVSLHVHGHVFRRHVHMSATPHRIVSKRFIAHCLKQVVFGNHSFPPTKTIRLRILCPSTQVALSLCIVRSSVFSVSVCHLFSFSPLYRGWQEGGAVEALIGGPLTLAFRFNLPLSNPPHTPILLSLCSTPRPLYPPGRQGVQVRTVLCRATHRRIAFPNGHHHSV